MAGSGPGKVGVKVEGTQWARPGDVRRQTWTSSSPSLLQGCLGSTFLRKLMPLLLWLDLMAFVLLAYDVIDRSLFLGAPYYFGIVHCSTSGSLGPVPGQHFPSAGRHRCPSPRLLLPVRFPVFLDSKLMSDLLGSQAYMQPPQGTSAWAPCPCGKLRATSCSQLPFSQPHGGPCNCHQCSHRCHCSHSSDF